MSRGPPPPPAGKGPKPLTYAKPAEKAIDPAAILAQRQAAKKVQVKESSGLQVEYPPKLVQGIYHWFNLPDELQFIKTRELEALWTTGTKAILVDFFAYSCTNCIRCVPVLKQLKEKYEKEGLKIVAFHRPEFEFERNPFNMKDFLERENISYVVGLDNKDQGWNDWKVELWPQHFLVTKSSKGESIISYKHYGDRKHDELEKEIVKALWKGKDEPAPECHPLNRESFIDAEFFMGKAHRSKNHVAGKGCSDGACHISKGSSKAAVNYPAPEATGYTIYGASWCPYCRKSEALLEVEGLPFKWIDTDNYGGAANVRAGLEQDHGLPSSHKTIPCIYFDGKFIGGYSAMVDALKSEGKASDANVEAATEKSANANIDFEKGLTRAHIGFNAPEWSTTDEYIVAKKDGATLTMSFNVDDTQGAKAVHMYLITEVPHDQSLTEKREKQLSSLTNEVEESQKPFAIFSEKLLVSEQSYDHEPNAFHPKKVTVTTKQCENVVQLTYPGRHLAFSFPACEVSKYEINCNHDFQLTFEEGVRIYTIYLTTEVPK